MTEDEARKKWCPFARVIQFDIDEMPTGNRLYTASNDEMNFDGPALCIASECMAWRTYDLRVAPTSVIPNGQGYCGLAGKI